MDSNNDLNDNTHDETNDFDQEVFKNFLYFNFYLSNFVKSIKKDKTQNIAKKKLQDK